MFFIFGWMRRFTVLGAKLEDCSNCGQVCEHIVGRRRHWGHVFWFPVLFLGISHGLICSNCGAWTSLPWQAVRTAMKTGTLHFSNGRGHTRRPSWRPWPVKVSRPQFPGRVRPPGRQSQARAMGSVPQGVAGRDRPTAGRRRPVTSPDGRPAPGGRWNSALSQPASDPAHQCWAATDGSISGCRLVNGSVQGDATGTPITCYFTEPLPETATTLSCDSN